MKILGTIMILVAIICLVLAFASPHSFELVKFWLSGIFEAVLFGGGIIILLGVYDQQH